MKRVGTALLTLAGVTGTVAGVMGAAPFDGPRRSGTPANGNQPPASTRPIVGPWGEPVQTMPRGVGSPTNSGSSFSIAPAAYQPQTPEQYIQASHMHPPVGGGGVDAMAGNGAAAAPAGFTTQRSQIRFVGPAKSKIGWYVSTGGDGQPVMGYQVAIPGVYNFLQASIYRLKLSDIESRPGLRLFPTVEVVPANAKTTPFLAHNFIPVEFTEDDFDQVTAGNYITKVIYLPDPQFQNPIGTGPEELISTRLEPGVDPVAEAHRRGNILLIVRLGGVDLEANNSPPLDGQNMFGAPRAMVIPSQPVNMPTYVQQAPMFMPDNQPVIMPMPASNKIGTSQPLPVPGPNDPGVSVPVGSTIKIEDYKNNSPAMITVSPNGGQVMPAMYKPTMPQYYMRDNAGRMVPFSPSTQPVFKDNTSALMPAANMPTIVTTTDGPVLHMPMTDSEVRPVSYGPAGGTPVMMETVPTEPAKTKKGRKGLFNGFGSKN